MSTETYAYSVDRTETKSLRWALSVPPSRVTKFHAARPDDNGLARCSTHIVLNPERHRVETLPVAFLCARCFPGVTKQVPGGDR